MKNMTHKFVLVTAICVGLSHIITWAMPLDALWVVTWKGASVGLLTLFAGLNAKSKDGWLLTAILALSAISDVLIVTIGSTEGGLVFMVADILAITLYIRNRKQALPTIRTWTVLMIIPLASAFAYFVVADRNEALSIAIFILPLAAMAASAWLSKFPRNETALGATMVLCSDLLIFARQGPLDGIPALSYAVWLLYFAGEVMVCTGVVRTLVEPEKLASPFVRMAA